MHLVIISGAARPRGKSNTAKIIDAFRKGFEQRGNTTEVWYLSDSRQWAGAADGAYLNRWMDRVMLNLGGESLGARPISEAKELLVCI